MRGCDYVITIASRRPARGPQIPLPRLEPENGSSLEGVEICILHLRWNPECPQSQTFCARRTLQKEPSADLEAPTTPQGRRTIFNLIEWRTINEKTSKKHHPQQHQAERRLVFSMVKLGVQHFEAQLHNPISRHRTPFTTKYDFIFSHWRGS